MSPISGTETVLRNSTKTWRPYEEVKSDVVPFEQRPWMKSAEITDKLIEAIKSGKYDFLRTNYPNGDMVGHTGNYEATDRSVWNLSDLQLARVKEAGRCSQRHHDRNRRPRQCR